MSASATTTAVYNARKDVNNNLFVIEFKSIGSKSYAANTSSTYSVSISKSGYTAVGVVGFNTASYHLMVNTIGAENGKLTMCLRNVTSNAVTANAGAHILWKRNNI